MQVLSEVGHRPKEIGAHQVFSVQAQMLKGFLIRNAGGVVSKIAGFTMSWGLCCGLHVKCSGVHVKCSGGHRVRFVLLLSTYACISRES